MKLYRKLDVDIKIVFSSFKVGNYFSLKSKTPLGLRAKVVYQYQCSCDRTLSYIGKTKRHLATRCKEHFTQQSAISNHLQHCDTCKKSFDITKFQILDTSMNDFELQIKEALQIKSKKPKLNIQLANQGAFFNLGVF